MICNWFHDGIRYLYKEGGMARFEKINAAALRTDAALVAALMAADFSPSQRGDGTFVSFPRCQKVPASAGTFGIILPKGGMIIPGVKPVEIEAVIEQLRTERRAAEEETRAAQAALLRAMKARLPEGVTLSQSGEEWTFSFYGVARKGGAWPHAGYVVHRGDMPITAFEMVMENFGQLVAEILSLHVLINDRGWNLFISWEADGRLLLAATGGESWVLGPQPLEAVKRLEKDVWPQYWEEILAVKAELAKIPFLKLEETAFSVKVFNAERKRRDGYDDGRDSLSLREAREYLAEWGGKGQAALEEIEAALSGVTPETPLRWERGQMKLGGKQVGSSSAIARAIFDEAVKRGLRTPLQRQIEEARQNGHKLAILSRVTCDPMGHYDDRRGRDVNGPTCWELSLKMGEAEFKVVVGEEYLSEPEPGIYEYAKSASA